MQRNALQLLAIGCLVVLAGCSGALPGGDGAQTLDDVNYPDGVSENGTNVSALADGHAEALNESNFTLAFDMTQNRSQETQSVEMDAAVSADRDEIRMNASTPGQQTSMYLTTERQYTRLTPENQSEGEPIYDVSNRTDEGMQMIPASYSGATYVEQFGANAHANFTPTGVEVRDGTTLIELEADGDNVSAPDGTTVKAYDATVLVDEEGVVHSFEVTVETERDGTTTNVTLSMELSDLGETSVEEPPWLDEARNQTSD